MSTIPLGTEQSLVSSIRTALEQGQMMGFIGLMSGTSMDGVDAAFLATDGEVIARFGPSLSRPYPIEVRETLTACVRAMAEGRPINLDPAARAITEMHISTVQSLLSDPAAQAFRNEYGLAALGFHGHTVFHDPDGGRTVQIGLPGLLYEAFEVPVIHDFRGPDVAGGGQGAPLLPIFHASMMKEHMGPSAVLNIGGVANLTLFEDAAYDPLEPLKNVSAFDTGPGNALIDDWMSQNVGERADWDGNSAARGQVHWDRIEVALRHEYFSKPPPKSLDRQAWSSDLAEGLTLEDGAATLTCFTAETILKGFEWLSARPKDVVVCGGGRKNKTLMAMLDDRLGGIVRSAEALGFDGDAIEAQGFALMAARFFRGLPSTFPETTGVRAPTVAGRLFPDV